LALYDLIAVWGTKHMIFLCDHLRQRGIMVSFILPRNINKLNKGFLEQKTKSEYVFLGGGDLAFPLMLAVSAFKEKGLILSLSLIAGALFGLLIISYKKEKAKKQKPWPALPPIVLGCLLAYLLFTLIK
jgi:presenilin-like A22 family membrane protease